MSIQSDVVKLINKPRTIKEIAELTGHAAKQVEDSINAMRNKGVIIQAIGHGVDRHYYRSIHKPVRVKPWLYEQILDLTANTGDWWSLKEIEDVLDVDAHKIASSIRRVEIKGIATVERKRGKSQKSYYRIETIK